MAWLNGWTYRKAITITEQSGSDLTNFQKRIDLDNTNFDFTKAKADGSDIRITTSDGTTLLDIWKEEWDATNQIGKIWVKIPSLLANSSVTLYLYYGNPDAVDADNPEGVFILFDDFDTADYNVIRGSSGQVSIIDNTWLRIDATSGYSSEYDIIVESGKASTIAGNFIVEGKVLLEQPNEWVGWIVEAEGDGYEVGWYGAGGTEGSIIRWIGWGYEIIQWMIPHFVAQAGSVQILRWDRVNEEIRMWDTDGSVVIATVTDGTHNTFSKVAVRLCRDGIWQIDWVRVRKYASVEPSVSIGVEETSGGVVYSESLLDTVSLSESSKSMLSIINADSINAVSLEKQNPHTGQSDAVPVLDAQKFDVVNINRSIATIVEIERLNTLNKLLELSTLIDYLKSNPTVPESDVATLNDVLSYVTLRVQSLSDVSVVNDANTINALNRALESVTTIESLSPSLSAKIKEFVALVDKILAIIAGLNRDSLTLTDALTESIISGAQTQTILDGLVVGDSLIMDLLAIHAAKIALSDLLKTDSTDAMVDSVGIFETIAVDTALRILNSLTASETLTAVPVTILQELIPTLELLTSESNKLLIVLSDIISALDIDKALVTGKLKDSIDAEDLLQVIAYQLAAAIVSLLSKIALLAALESVTAVLEQNKSIINQKVNLESGTTSLKGGKSIINQKVDLESRVKK